MSKFHQARQRGFKVTIKLLEGRLKEVEFKNSDDESSSESSTDAAEQIKFLQELIDEQKEKEVLEQSEIDAAKAWEKGAKERKMIEEEEVYEFMMQEDEVKKLQEFCKENGIEMHHKDHLHEVLDKILHEGRGHDHSGGRDPHSQSVS